MKFDMEIQSSAGVLELLHFICMSYLLACGQEFPSVLYCIVKDWLYRFTAVAILPFHCCGHVV